MKSDFRTVGIDPGINYLGLAELLDGELVDLAVYNTDKADGQLLRDRLAEIEGDVAPHVLGAHVIVTESPSFPKGAVAAAMLWAAYGLIRGLARFRADVHTFTPGEWRRELGLPTEKRGPTDSAGDVERRRKAATQALVLKRYPAAELRLALVPPGKRHHAYDALAMASAFEALRARRPAQTTFPEDLDGTTW